MKKISKARADKMGTLNNALVQAIDESGLQPPDVVLVLRLLVARVESAFIASLTNMGEKHGG